MKIGHSAVRVLAAGPGDSLAAVCLNELPKIFAEGNLTQGLEFGEGVHDSMKVHLLSFQPQMVKDEVKLVTADEDKVVGLWAFTAGDRSVRLVKKFELAEQVSAIGWDLSSLGVTVVTESKQQPMQVSRIEQKLEEGGDWELTDSLNV